MTGRGSVELPKYITPTTTEIDEDHVRNALDFLIAVEPVPPPASRQEYEAATGLYRRQVAAAMATIRAFVLGAAPRTLDRMQIDYYGFTNDPRYLVSEEVSTVVRGALDEAWNGVGPWRR
jgi:hypothetical protein